MWNDRYLEHRILTASPLELVVILYEHTIRSVQDARRHLAAKEIASRATAICKAIMLISELRSSLNHEVGGEISQNLESLYKYMQKRLTDANMRQEDEPLGEVESLLQQLAEAWVEISKPRPEEAPAAEETIHSTDDDCANWAGAFTAHMEMERPASYWSA